jgi:hypothetical protein
MPKASISLTPLIIWVPLFYLVLLSFPPLGLLILFSPTQFCSSDKHFLTFPPLSSTQFSSLILTGWSLIGRDVCQMNLGWLIAQRTLAPLDHLWSDGLYISLYLDGRIQREEQSTYLPTLEVVYSSRIFLSYSGGRGGADLQRACVRRRGSNHAAAWI